MPRLIRAALESAGLERHPEVATGVDVVGSIAIVRLPSLKPAEKKKLAAALLESVPSVKGVFEQTEGIEGEYRLRKLKHIAGVRTTLTVHRENGCAFKVDVAKCYFTPRLSTERLRVTDEIRAGARVLNMFAGVGPFSVLIAKKKANRVTSCELNPYACELHEENNRTNKVERRVEVVNADARDLPSLTSSKFDEVLMPHPSMADRFLSTALSLARPGARVFYYRHLPARNEEEGAELISKELKGLPIESSRTKTRRVRVVGPRWLEMLAEIRTAS